MEYVRFINEASLVALLSAHSKATGGIGGHFSCSWYPKHIQGRGGRHGTCNFEMMLHLLLGFLSQL